MRIDRTTLEVGGGGASAVEPGLLRLLQLSSATLPVGAYSYSQGLESAVAMRTVTDTASAGRWIGDHLVHGIARFEAPVWWRLYAAWAAGDLDGVRRWNDLFVATRDAAELRMETVQMGRALIRLARDAALVDAATVAALEALDPVGYPAAFGALAAAFAIPPGNALAGYLWAWIESQVLAAMKAVPLGQVAGQRLLAGLASRVPDIVAAAAALSDDELSGFLPGLAIESCRHETQYSRIFRS
jgi:urease accessory protein